MMKMKSLHSILTLSSIIAFAGNIIAAPVPADYEPARQTQTVWRTYTYTKVVEVTKTEWVNPVTADEEEIPSSTGYSSYDLYPTITDPTEEEGTMTTPYSSDDTDPNVVYMTTSTTVTSTDLTVETYIPEPETSDPPIIQKTAHHKEISPPTVTPDVTTPPVITPPVYTPSSSTPTPTPSPEPQQTTEEQTSPKAELTSEPSGPWEGEATYYDAGLGSCGYTNTNSDFIVALSHVLMEKTDNGNPNTNPLCGRSIKCTRGSKQVVVKVVDTCPGCKEGDIDLSPAAFQQIAETSEGRVKVEWNWV